MSPHPGRRLRPLADRRAPETDLRRALSRARARWLVASLAVAPHLPAPLVHGVGALAADLAWRRRGGGVRQLETTLVRALPVAAAAGPHPGPGAAVRSASRAAMRSYARYWCDAVALPGWSRERLAASVHATGLEPLAAELAAGRGVVVFLGHLGSWDQLGAWAAATLAPVVTVAERLEPFELFEAFTAARARVGITALPLDHAGTSAALVRAARAGRMVALLGDRDLAGSGVEVDLLGESARLAPGPAAVALSTGTRLFSAACTYRWLAPRWWWAWSPRRRWGLAVDVREVELPTVAGTGAPRRAAREQAVRAATQACADHVGAAVRARPQDWHVLQPVFAADVAAARAFEPRRTVRRPLAGPG